MKHRSNQILFAHWDERRAGRVLPDRGEIDPGAIRSALSDTFVLSFNPLAQHPFRLAGTRLCALFGRELKGCGFVDLWSWSVRPELIELVSAVADESVGLLAGVAGRAQGGFSLDLELLLLPLTHGGDTHSRLIGALSPLDTPYWLGNRPLVSLSLTEFRFMGQRSSEVVIRPSPSVAPGVRVRHGMLVYDGGQK